jgi:hypothetical protein
MAGPVVAPFGIVAVKLPAVQLLVVAAVPLKVIVPAAPKFDPVTVTEAPIAAP